MLKTEQLAAYLPYSLMCMVDGKQAKMDSVYSDGTCTFFDLVESQQGFKSIKPILRPFDDIGPYFEKLFGCKEHGDVTEFLDEDFLDKHNNLSLVHLEYITATHIPYGTLSVLLKHHFDVFRLIEQGLAISINDLK